MSKKIKKLIKKTRHRLTWPVTEVPARDNVLQIVSDHRDKTHTIYMPDQDVRPLEWLHEYGHATLCETVNPMFSTQYFARGTDQSAIEAITPAAQAASDWFIDQWLFVIAPQESVVEIRQHLDMVVAAIRHDPSGTPELFAMACLMIAQGKKYCGIQTPTTGTLDTGVNALLSVDPATPTADKLCRAVNGLLACYSNLRVQHDIEDGLDCWRITETKK